MKSESVDMIFADPPYFLSNNGITCQGGKMVSVNKGSWDMMMNVSRPSLHRELKNLEMRDMITYEPPAILIKDAEKLQQILG